MARCSEHSNCGSNPYDIAFDGTNIWVTNSFHGGTLGTVSKLRASDGEQLLTFEELSPSGIAFDGKYIWVANSNHATLTKRLPSDGSIVGRFHVGRGPFALAFDGTNMWVTLSYDKVAKVRASDGKVLGTFRVGRGPHALAFDGENIWVVNDSNTVTKLRASDGKVLGTFDVEDTRTLHSQAWHLTEPMSGCRMDRRVIWSRSSRHA